MLDKNNITELIKNEESTILPIYFPSPLYYSLNSALNLAMILTNPETHKWFVNCFLQLAFNKDYPNDPLLHPLDIYPANMVRLNRHGETLFKHESTVDIDGVMIEDKPEELINRVKRWLRGGFYVLSLKFDVTKLKGTKWYGKKPFMHDVLCFGYDDEKKAFKFLDFDDRGGQLAIIDISYDDFYNATYSPIVKQHIFYLIMTKKTATYEFNFELYKMFIYDYINSINTEKKYIHITGSRGEYWWGLGIYEPFIEFVDYCAVNRNEIKYKAFHALYEHKKCLVMSYEYLTTNNIICKDDAIYNELNIIMDKANDLKALVLKYNHSKNKELLVKIKNYLREIFILEKETLNKFFGIISRYN